MDSAIHQSITKVGYTLYPVAYKFCKDTETAHDIVQDTILKALLNADRYKEGTNLKGWLYTIMRNVFINEYRRKKRYQFMESSTDFDIRSTREQLAYNEGMANIGREEIEEQMQKVEEKYTMPFLLHFTGFKYEEIAEQLALPIGTVKNRIHIARKSLQDNLRFAS
ncbi:MAG: RNA polymerase sigma factor [Bacteroidia bacterium]